MVKLMVKLIFERKFFKKVHPFIKMKYTIPIFCIILAHFNIKYKIFTIEKYYFFHYFL